MMSEKCHKCNKVVTRLFERQLAVCMDCVGAFVDEINAGLKKGLETAEGWQKLYEKEKAEKEKIQTILAEVATVKKAELEGMQDFVAGTPISACPYDSSDENGRQFWEIGWRYAHGVKSYDRIRALMLWTTEHLAHVLELARGYGQQEIATKLLTVFEKVSHHMEETNVEGRPGDTQAGKGPDLGTSEGTSEPDADGP